MKSCNFLDSSGFNFAERLLNKVLAEVLANRIERGLLTEDVAFDIVKKILRENAVEVFNLEERLGREF